MLWIFISKWKDYIGPFWEIHIWKCVFKISFLSFATEIDEEMFFDSKIFRNAAFSSEARQYNVTTMSTRYGFLCPEYRRKFFLKVKPFIVIIFLCLSATCIGALAAYFIVSYINSRTLSWAIENGNLKIETWNRNINPNKL